MATTGRLVPRSGLLAGRRGSSVRWGRRRRRGGAVPRCRRSAAGLPRGPGRWRRRRSRYPAHSPRPDAGAPPVPAMNSNDGSAGTPLRPACRPTGSFSAGRRATTTRRAGFPALRVDRPASHGPGTAATTARRVPRSRAPAGRRAAGVAGAMAATRGGGSPGGRRSGRASHGPGTAAATAEGPCSRAAAGRPAARIDTPVDLGEVGVILAGITPTSPRSTARRGCAPGAGPPMAPQGSHRSQGRGRKFHHSSGHDRPSGPVSGEPGPPGVPFVRIERG